MDDQTDGQQPAVTTKPRKSRRRRLTPYLLIAPTVVYLAAFFAYPMFEGLKLAVWDDEALLPLLAEPRLLPTENRNPAPGCLG